MEKLQVCPLATAPTNSNAVAMQQPPLQPTCAPVYYYPNPAAAAQYGQPQLQMQPHASAYGPYHTQQPAPVAHPWNMFQVSREGGSEEDHFGIRPLTYI